MPPSLRCLRSFAVFFPRRLTIWIAHSECRGAFSADDLNCSFGKRFQKEVFARRFIMLPPRLPLALFFYLRSFVVSLLSLLRAQLAWYRFLSLVRSLSFARNLVFDSPVRKHPVQWCQTGFKQQFKFIKHQFFLEFNQIWIIRMFVTGWLAFCSNQPLWSLPSQLILVRRLIHDLITSVVGEMIPDHWDPRVREHVGERAPSHWSPLVSWERWMCQP